MAALSCSPAGEVQRDHTWLMGQGLTLPWTFPERIHVIEGERL